jgi:two-component system LytT family response regulator
MNTHHLDSIKLNLEAKEIPLYPEDGGITRLLDQRLIVQTQSYIHLIDRDKIAYLQAEGNYTNIVLTDGSAVLSSRVLKSFEKQLRNKCFMRVHGSFLVNFEKIVGIKRNGVYTLVLENNMEIPVSNSRKEGLFQLLRQAQN